MGNSFFGFFKFFPGDAIQAKALRIIHALPIVVLRLLYALLGEETTELTYFHYAI